MNQEIIMEVSERKAIDNLVSEFWRLGFFTIRRRLGTYLPEPENVGKFKVDVIGRLKEKYAIGITLSPEEIFSSDLIEKINYLASRKTKFSDKPILLLIGVPEINFKQVKEILSNVDGKYRKNIKLVRIFDEKIQNRRKKKSSNQVVFS